MDNQDFIDARVGKIEGIVGDVPAKGLEWGIFAVLVQIAFMFIPLIRAAEQSVHPTRGSLRSKKYRQIKKVLRSPRAGNANR